MKCPYCRYIHTDHETMERETDPEEGDISFCIDCGEVGLYKGKRIVKTKIEKLPQENQAELQALRMAWLRTKAMTNLK